MYERETKGEKSKNGIRIFLFRPNSVNSFSRTLSKNKFSIPLFSSSLSFFVTLQFSRTCTFITVCIYKCAFQGDGEVLASIVAIVLLSLALLLSSLSLSLLSFLSWSRELTSETNNGLSLHANRNLSNFLSPKKNYAHDFKRERKTDYCRK